MKEPLTKVQEKIYAYIAGYIDDNIKEYGKSIAPTSQEIAIATNLTTQMVESHVKNIVAKKWLAYNGKRFRKIELVPKK